MEPRSLRGEQSRKPLEEIERELIRLDKKFNVNPKSKSIPLRVTNCAKRLMKNHLNYFTDDVDLKSFSKDVKNWLHLQQHRGPLIQDRIAKLCIYIEQFFEEVLPDSLIRNVSITFLTSNPHVVDQVSLADIQGVEVIFNTPEGNFYVQEMGPICLEIFCIAMIYAKMKTNGTNKVITLKDCDDIPGNIMKRIVDFFLKEEYQVILQRDEAFGGENEENMEVDEESSINIDL